MNGNRPSEVLVGEEVTLVMHCILFPKATAAELNSYYLYNATSPGQEKPFYLGSQICHAEDDAGLT